MVKRIVLTLIIVASNHTRIEAWVNSKMSERNPLVYCTIPLIAMQRYHTKQKTREAWITTRSTTLIIIYYYYYVWYFVFLSGLSCTTYICIWLPFLPYAYYMWLPWVVSFLSLGFSPPESLLGDDVLCSYVHARFLLSAFYPVCLIFILFYFFPTVFVPDLFWCNFLYLVTTQLDS